MRWRYRILDSEALVEFLFLFVIFGLCAVILWLCGEYVWYVIFE